MKKEKSKKNKYSLAFILDFVTDSFVTAIKKINKFLTDKKKNVIVRAIIRVIVCLLMLSILEIPFFLVGKLGLGIIYLLTTTFRDSISLIWVSVIDYSYMIFSFIVLFKVVFDMSKRKDYKIELNAKNKKENNLYETICIVLKAIIGIALIPLMLVALLLFAVLGMLICLITHGFYIISPIIITVGLLIIICTSLSYISDIVFFDEGGKK